MNRVFADSSYWIAHLNPADSLHRRAREVARTLSRSLVVTSEMVLTEMLNALSADGSERRQAGALLVSRLRTNPGHEIVPQTSDLFQKALAIYEARRDNSWGLTDCASFAIMQDLSIQDALSSDGDFEQAGFVALLRDR